MATAKNYDPVKSIEGMYHGTVTRIAYALKDPGNFGQSTKAIIQECSKQYQDALDDCQIQILDAKWYLERELKLRKERREAQAREEQAASAKRKHSEIEDAADTNSDAKRVKVEESSTQPEEDIPTQEPSQPEPTQPEQNKSPAVVAKEQPKQEKAATPQKVELTIPDKPPETLDDLFSARPTPADPGTAAGTLDGADDFNQFESMFGEAGGDDGMGNNDGDLGFDLGMDDDVFGDANATGDDPQGNDASDLNSLLPGLESYANQNSNPTATDNTQNNGTQALDFGLPELGGPNEFDMMFDEGNFDGLNLEGDMNMNEDDNNNLDLNMDLESMFS